MTISETRGLALESIADVDPVLWEAMQGERRRQHDNIELIASENYVSAAVMEAQGSWLTNKYAEGLPGQALLRRLRVRRRRRAAGAGAGARPLPGAEHVNVQPHSGAQANMAAYFSVLQPGDRILGMNLAHGGHLTHGMALNFSGKLYEVSAYGVRQDTELIDYDELEATASAARPKLIVAGASAYPRLWDFERMAAIAHGVGALLFVDMAHIAGLVAAGVHPSPFPHADIVTTTTHKTLRGPRGGLIFARNELPDGIDPADFPALKGPLGAGDRQDGLPGRPGRPADARDRRQGRRVQAGGRGAVPRGPAAHGRERRGAGADARRPGGSGRVGRHGQPPDARRRDAARRDRQGSRAPARRDRDHGQQERHPVRSACRPTRRPASAWARRPPRPVASARTRCAPSGGSSSRRSTRATTTPSSGGWPARSPRSSAASRSRGCRLRDDAPRDIHRGGRVQHRSDPGGVRPSPRSWPPS